MFLLPNQFPCAPQLIPFSAKYIQDIGGERVSAGHSWIDSTVEKRRISNVGNSTVAAFDSQECSKEILKECSLCNQLPREYTGNEQSSQTSFLHSFARNEANQS
jgi:hypothetical protein